MITESQKAFEDSHLELDLDKFLEGSKKDFYIDEITRNCWLTWQLAMNLGEAYGRKQALEELQAIYHRTYPSLEAQLAAIKELIK